MTRIEEVIALESESQCYATIILEIPKHNPYVIFKHQNESVRDSVKYIILMFYAVE